MNRVRQLPNRGLVGGFSHAVNGVVSELLMKPVRESRGAIYKL
jgi:hypothetical protein